jgi:uncharacterized caspase-like protein
MRHVWIIGVLLSLVAGCCAFPVPNTPLMEVEHTNRTLGIVTVNEVKLNNPFRNYSGWEKSLLENCFPSEKYLQNILTETIWISGIADDTIISKSNKRIEGQSNLHFELQIDEVYYNSEQNIKAWPRFLAALTVIGFPLTDYFAFVNTEIGIQGSINLIDFERGVTIFVEDLNIKASKSDENYCLGVENLGKIAMNNLGVEAIKHIKKAFMENPVLLSRAKALSETILSFSVAKPNQHKPSVSIAKTPFSIPSDPSTPTGISQRWAVIMGVSNYHDTRIPSLRYASADAQAFYDWIISPEGGKYAPSRVKLLIDQEATGKNIKNALFTWLNQAIAEDIVTIYFAGHGSPNNPESPDNLFLYPYDTQYNNVAATGFPMWDIETALKRFIKAKKVIVVADACHAGGIGQPFDVAMRDDRGVGGIANPIATGFQNLSKVGDGICVISASGEKQLSKESKEWGGGHGVFTYFLLKGLKGEADYNKDESVTLGELIPFLSEQVRRETRNAQSPTVAGKFDPALGIGR